MRNALLLLSSCCFFGCSSAPSAPPPESKGVTLEQPVQTPPDWDRQVTRPSDGDAVANRASCVYDRGALPGETLGASTPVGSDIPIQNVVVLMQENRSFDSYFARFCDYTGRTDVECGSASATNPTSISDPSSPPHPVVHAPALCEADTEHDWWAVHMQYDNGAMDGFFQSNDGYSETTYSDPSLVVGDRALWYYDQTDIPFYYQLAATFGLGDHYHSSVLGPTYPNRDYLYAATSRGVTTDDYEDTSGLDFPGYDLVIFDELEKRHVSWKIYKAGFAAGVESTIGTGAVFRWGTFAYPEHFKDMEDFYEDAANGTLPSVAFVDPQLTGSNASEYTEGYDTKSDEHPPGDIQVGEKFTSDVVQALFASPQWSQLAMFITWDEHGGLYDHVAPPAACPPDGIAPNLTNAQDQAWPAGFDQLGVRVPVIVVSPFSKVSYVSHTVYDHTSITRFIETLFTLPALTARDANADPMLDFFDFQNVPFAAPPQMDPAVVDPDQLSACKATFDP
jgi:phospholipase C